MRKVLLLAYYFPPIGLSGVQPIAKLVKYLPDFGWEPWVVTVGDIAYWAFDSSLLEEVKGSHIIRTPSLDPPWLLGRLKKKEVKVGRRTQDLFVRLHQAFLVPDNKLGWTPFALGEGMKLLRQGGFGAIYATGPPFTSHLVGALLKSRTGVPLALDFRDPWSRSPFLSAPSPLHRAAHSFLERLSLRLADVCTVVHGGLRGNLNLPERAPEVVVIPNGFDPEDFLDAPSPEGDRFTVTYTGAFYGNLTPKYLLGAVKELLEDSPGMRKEIRLVFVGNFRDEERELVRDWGLEDVVETTGYLPHRESVRRLCRTHLAWFMLGRVPFVEIWVPGKLAEYIGARKPILACVPEGETARVVRRAGGKVVPPEDVGAIREALIEYYERWKEGKLPSVPDEVVREYDWRCISARLADLLNSLT